MRQTPMTQTQAPMTQAPNTQAPNTQAPNTPTPNTPTPRDEALARLTAPGQRFEIRDEPVRGAQLPVFANRHRSLAELLEASRQHGDADNLVPEDERLSHEIERAHV